MTGIPIDPPEPEPCPDCDAPILKCSNSVWLDATAKQEDRDTYSWTVLKAGPFHMAASGGQVLGPGHLRHRWRLHEHQPPEAA